MIELNRGWNVSVKGGELCQIISELGRGGQGIVYKVKLRDKEYALKWYTVPYSDDFYDNLEKNVHRGAPNKNFVWPLFITERQHGSFGYIMELRPAGYMDMCQFILARAKFASVDVQLNACLQIVKAFWELHRNGYSYQDMNDGNFFINPQTGDVLICDNDNVAPNDKNLGILGKAGYMAPEIVEGIAKPNVYTDYYSLAVCLFMLIYMNRPFEGKFYLSCPCDNNPEMAKKLFGFESVFIMDPKNRSNAPDERFHRNVLRRWNIYPRILQDAFCRTFSREAQKDGKRRVSEREWKDILLQVRASFAQCPLCKNKTFIDPDDAEKKCVFCGQMFSAYPYIKIGKFKVPLVSGHSLPLCIAMGVDERFDETAANVIENKGQIGLLNKSKSSWIVTCSNGENRMLPPSKSMPAREGYVIRFGNQGCEGVIQTANN